MDNKTKIICIWCIQGIRSHAGERLFVGDREGDEPCEICGEKEDDRYECIWE